MLLEEHGLKDVIPAEYKRIIHNRDGLEVYEKPSVVASDFNDRNHINQLNKIIRERNNNYKNENYYQGQNELYIVNQ